MGARLDGTPEAVNNVFVRYGFYAKDTSGALQYFGFEITDAQWAIMRLDTTTSVQLATWANVSNNPTKTSMKLATTGAWDSRASLTYSAFSDLTGV